jgi:hypothetical protein
MRYHDDKAIAEYVGGAVHDARVTVRWLEKPILTQGIIPLTSYTGTVRFGKTAVVMGPCLITGKSPMNFGLI